MRKRERNKRERKGQMERYTCRRLSEYCLLTSCDLSSTCGSVSFSTLSRYFDMSSTVIFSFSGITTLTCRQ